MNKSGRIGGILALLILSATMTRGGLGDLEIHCVPKKVDEAKNSSESTTHAKEHWNYEVTIENKTFKDLAKLEVKYIAFYKQQELGTRTEKKTRQNGSFPVEVLKSHEKKSFATTAVELKNAHLTNDYYFSDGGRQAARDTLEGLWVRIYQDGQQISEYANPSILLKEKWE